MKKVKTILLIVFALGVICHTLTLHAQMQQTIIKKANQSLLDEQLGRSGTISSSTDQSVSKELILKSQSRRNQNGRSKVDIQKAEKVIKEVPEYYANYVRKDGWFFGINKLNSLDDARRRGCYYKFSRKNKAGNWTLVEAFNGYDKPTSPEDYETYLVDPYDESDYYIDSQWKERLQDVCKWSFLSDNLGKTVVQEIAMDANGDTVFVFTPIKVGEREFVGSYSDPRGIPIYLRSDDGNHDNYASQVLITQDGDGRDEYIKYIDDYGFPQKNKDDVYMIQNKYDSLGRQISETSFDFTGVRMNNRHNYCEWKRQYKNNSCDDYFYDADSLPTKTTTYRFNTLQFNSNGSPKHFGRKSIEEVYGFRIYFDEFGRDTTVEFIDANGKQDVNYYGVHQIYKEYNDYGQVTYCAFFDSIGNLCARNHSDLSQIIYHYQDSEPVDKSKKLLNKKTNNKVKKINNPSRHIVIKEYLDKDSNYVIGDGGYCKQVLEFKNDTLVCQTDYKPNYIWLHVLSYIWTKIYDSLVESYVYQVYENSNTIQKWITKGNKGYQKIDSVDSKYRPISTAWYDLESNPINDVDTVKYVNYLDDYSFEKEDSLRITDDEREYRGFHKKIITYNDKDGIYTQTIQLFNKDGGPAYDKDNYYSKAVTIRDRINSTDTTYYYKDTRLTHIFVSQEDPKSVLHIQQYELTPYGERTRNYEDNLICYVLNGLSDVRGNQLAVYGQNEFGEPSYTKLYMGDEDFVFYLMDLQRNRYFDEELREYSYSEMADLINRLPKAFCIEITDTTTVAYQCGLRNGDIIVSFGDWTVSKDLMSNLDEFYLETILKADTTKTIKLLRHHPDKKSSEIVSCELPKGKISDLGFYPQKIYYTDKEAKRLEETCKNKVPLSQGEVKGDTTILLAVQKKGSLETTPLYYFSANKDAGILLYAKSYDNIWSVRKNLLIDQETGEIQFTPDNIYLTHDLNNLDSISEDYHHGGLEIVPIKVDKSLFERIMDFYESQSNFIPSDCSLEEQYRATNNPAITSKKLIGKWNLTIDELLPIDLKLILDKKNKATIILQIKYDLSECQFEYELRSNPQWILNGVCLDFDFNNATTQCIMTKFETQETDEEIINEWKKVAESHKETLINNFKLYDYFIIKDVTEEQFTVLDKDPEYTYTSEHVRVFTKVK